MEYQLDKAKSIVKWTGYQPENNHFGTVHFKQGKIRTGDGSVTGGFLQVDLNSITVTDPKLTPDKQKDLEGHLKSPEFFDLENHPSAVFEISEVKESHGQTTHIVTGEINIKGTSHKMEIPVNISIEKEKLDVKAKFSIARTHFGINFMIEESFGDKKVLPEFDVELHIVGVNTNH